MKKRTLRIISISSLAAFLCLISSFLVYMDAVCHPAAPLRLTDGQMLALKERLDEDFPERQQIIRPLPYKTVPAILDVWAESAILIDTATGCVLFEKNADEVIPPASMTKLMVMYIALKEVQAGVISLSDIVPLSPRSWAVNLPYDASRMVLGEGQRVSVDELLCGIAVDSGNDAAIALSEYIAGSVDEFVDRMNSEAAALGLKQTRFVEPSGYDEHNVTTAREFAAIARVYINTFPEALKAYHSRLEFSYPMAANKPSLPYDDIGTVTQYNTNKLLRLLEGCDGLKTGFIYESGYNLALTAKRGGVRFLSVTMKGTGEGSAQGNKGRIHDGKQIMEWAFAHFADYTQTKTEHYVVPVTCSREKAVVLLPAIDSDKLTVPFITGETPAQAAQAVSVSLEVPRYIQADVFAGDVCGALVYSIDGNVLQRIPLVADRTVKKGNIIDVLYGKAASLFMGNS